MKIILPSKMKNARNLRQNFENIICGYFKIQYASWFHMNAKPYNVVAPFVYPMFFAEELKNYNIIYNSDL